jgi:hypothetical protein
MNDKIRVSWDEVNSADVDQRLQQQSAIERANEHYQQQVAPSMPAVSGSRQQSFWYNSLIYMTMFGFLGGALGWPLNEVIFNRLVGESEAAQVFRTRRAEISEEVDTGRITEGEGEERTERLVADYRGNKYVDVLSDDSLSEVEQQLPLAELVDQDQVSKILSTFFFTSLAGLFIATCLSIADGVMARNLREVVINGAVGMCLGLIGGLVAGVFGDFLYALLGGGTLESGFFAQVLARSLSWAALGLFLAVAPGLVLRSPKKLLIGLAGGCVGGLIGGGMFDVIEEITGAAWLSRFVGLTAIGTVAGFGTGLIENVVKTGWLKVVRGLIAGKQFILYKNPTMVGSSPQCEIYLFKDTQVAPQHASIRKTPSGYEIQDAGRTTGIVVNGVPTSRAKLRNNDRLQIGSTEFVFQQKS